MRVLLFGLEEVLAQTPQHLWSKTGADSGRDCAGGILRVIMVEEKSWAAGGCQTSDTENEERANH